MPTVLRSGPYRFFLYAGDGGEPPHVHVERDAAEAKFWLDPFAWRGATALAGKKLTGFEGWSNGIYKNCWRVGMSSSAVDLQEVLALRAKITEDNLSVELADGRTIMFLWHGTRG
jgi:Domain of unknown function (DUF4160)